MSVLTILGNGLDLAHGLKTKFDDFMETLPIEQQEKYSVFRNKDNSWNCVESKYEELLRTIMDSREWKTVTKSGECGTNATVILGVVPNENLRNFR